MHNLELTDIEAENTTIGVSEGEKKAEQFGDELGKSEDNDYILFSVLSHKLQ